MRDELDVGTHPSVRSAVLVITLIISFKTVTRNARLKGRDEGGGMERSHAPPAKGMAWRPRGLRIERARGGAERARDPIIESSHHRKSSLVTKPANLHTSFLQLSASLLKRISPTISSISAPHIAKK